MKITLGWLKDHLETKAPLSEIVAALTHLGLEVETVTDPAQTYRPFVIARVLEVNKHPDADRLTVCRVDAGKGPVQVVCGAPNVEEGMKGVFAPAGSYIPGTDLDLKKAVIRGVESNGMLCSEMELMLSEDHEGIIKLADDAPVGKPFAAYAGLDDPVINVEITPNRQDCLGVRGIARDLAAKGLGKLKPRPIKAVPGRFESPVGLKLEFKKGEESACPLFAGRYLKGVKNGESPEWLKRRLRAIGLRPISALVDITNFVTFDRARPLHVYDAAKLSGAVRARIAAKGEKLAALDGKTYTLAGTECVIADGKKVLGLGGVMGGEETGCTERTTEVFVESALFDPVRTAATGRRHNIDSDARYRFERGVDPASAVPGVEFATRLILELCGGEASRPVIAGKVPAWEKQVPFRPERIATLGGVDLPAKDSLSILKKLGFAPAALKGGAAKVKVPSWRSDVSGEADLVEEVLRVHGYQHIPITSLPSHSAVPRPTLTVLQRRRRLARHALAAAGLLEAVTYSFMAAPLAKLFGGGGKRLALENPISSDLSVMRPSILPNLIQAAQRNADRGGARIALYEVGPQYADDTPQGEALVAAGVRLGAKTPRHWKVKSEPPHAIDAKGEAFAVLDACGIDTAKVQVSAEAPGWYHPFRSGTLRLGPKIVLGHFGEVHPKVLKKMDAAAPVSAFEVFLTNLPEPKARETRSRGALYLSQLPAVERDFAFAVDKDMPAAALVDAARKAEPRFVREVGVFDVFEGEGVEAGKKSVALSVRLEPGEKTFTDAEIEGISQAIVGAVQKATGGKLRA